MIWDFVWYWDKDHFGVICILLVILISLVDNNRKDGMCSIIRSSLPGEEGFYEEEFSKYVELMQK